MYNGSLSVQSKCHLWGKKYLQVSLGVFNLLLFSLYSRILKTLSVFCLVLT